MATKKSPAPIMDPAKEAIGGMIGRLTDLVGVVEGGLQHGAGLAAGVLETAAGDYAPGASDDSKDRELQAALEQIEQLKAAAAKSAKKDASKPKPATARAATASKRKTTARSAAAT